MSGSVREWSVGPPGFVGEVGRSSQMSGSGRKAPQISGSSQDTLSDIREWSGVVGRPPCMSWSVRE